MSAKSASLYMPRRNAIEGTVLSALRMNAGEVAVSGPPRGGSPWQDTHTAW